MDKIVMPIGAGILSGIISPFIVSWLQHKVIWKSQKNLEIKYSVFNNAVKALSQFATDALDPAMQKPRGKGVKVKGSSLLIALSISRL